MYALLHAFWAMDMASTIQHAELVLSAQVSVQTNMSQNLMWDTHDGPRLNPGATLIEGVSGQQTLLWSISTPKRYHSGQGLFSPGRITNLSGIRKTSHWETRQLDFCTDQLCGLRQVALHPSAMASSKLGICCQAYKYMPLLIHSSKQRINHIVVVVSK